MKKQPWSVIYRPQRVEGDIAGLPEKVRDKMYELMGQLVAYGPILPGWKKFGMLKNQKGQPRSEKRYHCHLASGRPTYVACWKVRGREIEVEVYYAGTHERAPY